MTIPLECLKSKQGNCLVIYRPHYAFSAFQKALEKGPASARSDCKHTTDSLDTLFSNAAGLFSFGPDGKANSLRAAEAGADRRAPRNLEVRVQWSPLAGVGLEHQQRQWKHLWRMEIVLRSPTGPQARPGWTWGVGGTETRHVVEVVPAPGPGRLSLRTVPKVLERGGVDDTHDEQQQQVQEYHDRKPMAGKPGQLARSPA